MIPAFGYPVIDPVIAIPEWQGLSQPRLKVGRNANQAAPLSAPVAPMPAVPGENRGRETPSLDQASIGVYCAPPGQGAEVG